MFDDTRLLELNCVQIDKIDKSVLVQINDVSIDQDMDVAFRIQRYLEQIKNPYCFLCGDTPVRIRFATDGQELDTKLRSYFISRKQK